MDITAPVPPNFPHKSGAHLKNSSGSCVGSQGSSTFKVPGFPCSQLWDRAFGSSVAPRHSLTLNFHLEEPFEIILAKALCKL